MPKASQRQNLVSVEGVAGYFATKAGGATSAEVTDVYDGGNPVAEKLAGPATTANVTVGRPWDPSRDAAVVRRLRAQVGTFRTTVTVQPTDADLVPIGGPSAVYAGALLVGVTEPDADAASSASAMIELEFAVESVR